MGRNGAVTHRPARRRTPGVNRSARCQVPKTARRAKRTIDATPGPRTAELYRCYQRREDHLTAVLRKVDEEEADAEAKVRRARDEFVKHLKDELGLPDESDEMGSHPGVVIGDQFVHWTRGGPPEDRYPWLCIHKVVGILPATKDPEAASADPS